MQNKYDTRITLQENSSLTYMVNSIEPGTKVLEFGPATGYMTQYLKEEKRCNVYIVEVDENAFEKAILYAVDGVCDNAENYKWFDKFRDIQFDYITFSDVLEHLINPWRTLRQASKLLKKDTGKILASIPNIGHNAVLIDLFNNKFIYRKTGIMDNTHLRFFTHDTMLEMFRKCGLCVVDEDAVIFDLKYAGLGNSKEDVPENIWNELRLREYGFVNQFLFTLSNNETGFSNKKKIMTSYELAIYYTESTEYCEGKKVMGEIQINGNTIYSELLFEKSLDIKQLMINLFPFPGILGDLKIESDVAIEHTQAVNGMFHDGKYYFWGDEMKIQLQCSKIRHPKYIRIYGTLETIQIKHMNRIIKEIEDTWRLKIQQDNQEIQRLNEIINSKIDIIHKIGKEIHNTEQRLTEKENILCDQTKYLEKKDTLITMQTQIIQMQKNTLDSQNRALDNYLQLLNEKKSLMEMQKEELKKKEQVTASLISEKNDLQKKYEQAQNAQLDLIKKLEQQIEIQKKELEEKETLISYIKNTKWFKIFGKQFLMDK